MRVVLYNNYDMELALERYGRHHYPGHHLWGALALRDRGWELSPLRLERFARLRRLTAPKIGDLDQQLRVFLDQGKHDLVISGTEYDTIALALLRRLGLYRRGILAVVHGPPKAQFHRRWLTKLCFNGQDRLLFLSDEVREEFVALGVDRDRTRLLEWGVDLDFYPAIPLHDDAWRAPYIFSAGKTRRDHATLVQAFDGLDATLRLYCSKESAPPIDLTPANVDVVFDPAGGEREAKVLFELTEEYRGCVAVAVPLAPNCGLAGLTSLLDAMAMSRAVIITRNPYIDIDVEREGIGLAVEPGEVAGWRAALEWVLTHPTEVAEMGRRARALCEARYNLETFSQCVVTAAEELTTARR
jgi:glycosyltransferase involved in cell wall biosynthesis